MPRQAQSGDARADRGGELRALEWSELVARLVALRELRATLAEHGESEFASFDSDMARRLAAQHDGHIADDQPRVNFENSLRGKGDATRKQPETKKP